MTRLYLSIFISWGTMVTNPSHAQLCPNSDPLSTFTFVTSPPDTTKAGYNTDPGSSQRCALTSSRSLTRTLAFTSALSGGHGVDSLYS